MMLRVASRIGWIIFTSVFVMGACLWVTQNLVTGVELTPTGTIVTLIIGGILGNQIADEREG